MVTSTCGYNRYGNGYGMYNSVHPVVRTYEVTVRAVARISLFDARTRQRGVEHQRRNHQPGQPERTRPIVCAKRCRRLRFGCLSTQLAAILITDQARCFWRTPCFVASAALAVVMLSGRVARAFQVEPRFRGQPSLRRLPQLGHPGKTRLLQYRPDEPRIKSDLFTEQSHPPGRGRTAGSTRFAACGGGYQG